MSMLDSFFNKGFKAVKCKTLLKLAIPRIKLLRNRREIQLKQMRRDIAKLLETGQEATARIRVEHIIREENMIAAQEIIELFCELIVVRLPIIETQRECPIDLKEAISSVCFAAPRCADLPELLQVQLLFASKYGKEFVSAATELMPSCGVNRQLIELLSVRAPSPQKKLNLLKEIAEEHELDWDPAASETEFLKPHEDLLNGPTQFASGSKLPLPKEKHDEISSTHDQINKDVVEPDSDTDFDVLDFPEIPKAPLRSASNVIASAPETVPHFVEDPQPENEIYTSKHPHVPENQPEGILNSEPKEEEGEETKQTNVPASAVNEDNKQFVPFISPPLFSSTSTLSSTRQHDMGPSHLSGRKSGADLDLQDVLAAAQAAAETAERAASAARSVASLAQVRISELTRKNSEREKSSENPFHMDKPTQLDQKNSFGDSSHGVFNSSEYLHGGLDEDSNLSSVEQVKLTFDSPPRNDHVFHGEAMGHQPQRLPSMEDDPYFSYPNLFTPQNLNLGSSSQSLTDNR